MQSQQEYCSLLFLYFTEEVYSKQVLVVKRHKGVKKLERNEN